MPSSFGSANGAWMFPCSGAAYFADLGKRSAVFQSFSRGKFPTATLPNFLHEATHHYCFDSVVGYALLAARVAAQYGGGYRFTCESDKRSGACLENISCCNRVAHSVGLTLLQPLAEGLAIYGQCDATPNQAPIASPIAFYVARAYLDYQQTTSNNFVATADFLRQERQRPGSQFESDLEILAKREPKYETYWRGYDLVRTLADVVNRVLNDTDATLGFLCSYFFHDTGLAGRIADLGNTVLSQRAASNTAVPAAEYIKDRIKRLLTDHMWRETAIGEYVRVLRQGLHPQEACGYTQDPHAQANLQSFMFNMGFESTAKLVLPTSTQNRRNFKCGSFIADSIEIRQSDSFVRCRFDEMVIEIKGLRDGFPHDIGTDGYGVIDGSPVVEFIFLDQYEPAIAMYNAHSLLALCDRTGIHSKTTPDDESRYGQLSPAIAFWHDMQSRQELWKPSGETPCGTYHQARQQDARKLGLLICDV